jgi:hypothetical protein
MNIKPRDHFIHFKGSIYVVDYIVYHTETDEPLVVYHEKLGTGKKWARPLSMWDDLVTKDGKSYPRFRRI